MATDVCLQDNKRLFSSGAGDGPLYLDCAATYPIDPRVREEVIRHFAAEFGNPGSRTHAYGTKAAASVKRAREQVAESLGVMASDVVFTSGATESVNLVTLGLVPEALASGNTHYISTEIEHPAVLDSLAEAKRRGIEVTLVKPESDGRVRTELILRELRDTTMLVSVMHVNNETGIIQPIREIADALADHPAFFHTDASQGFGRRPLELHHHRIDLVTISGHKIGAPIGVGALAMRRRRYKAPPLTPLLHGGGQERGLRPGTLALPLVAGLGLAAELAFEEADMRQRRAQNFKEALLHELGDVPVSIHGDQAYAVADILNLSCGTLDAEAVVVALKSIVAISTGSACTSSKLTPSHVLTAMGLSPREIRSATRWSWHHCTEDAPWNAIRNQLQALQG